MKNRYIPFLLIGMLWLSACGSSSRNPGAGDGGGDSYVNAVLALASEAPEDSEPRDVEAFAPTSPETGEPQNIL